MRRFYGNTATEYAIVIGLVGVLGVAALTGLGDSVYKVFLNTSSQMNGLTATSGGAIDRAVSDEPLNDGPVQLSGAGHAVISIDPATGEPRVSLNQNGENSNATSVEGSEWNATGGMMLANALEELAAKQTDPAAAAWMQEMAKLAYYQAGAESMLEGQMITPFEQNLLDSRMNGETYTAANAVTDLKTYQAQLKNLMQNPPAGISQGDFTQALAFASDAHNIAMDTVTAHASQLDPNVSPGGAPFDQLINLDTLKTNAKSALASSSIASRPVEAALNDAVNLDGM